MACRGCRRRQQGIIDQLQSGLRVSADIANRLRRTLNIDAEGKPAKYDNIIMTSEGVVKQCSLCGKKSEPAPTAAQCLPLRCEKCKQ